MPRQAPLEKLPRHRHNLSRALVHKTQKRRILRATAEVVARAGYRAATVADIVKRAGVSTRTFYELYADKDAALCAVYDAVDGIIARYYESHRDLGGGDARARLHAAVAFSLERLAADTTFTRLLIVESVGSGKRIQARRNQAFRRVAALIAATLPAPTDESLILAYLGGLTELVLQALGDAGVGGLPALLAPALRFTDALFFSSPRLP